jgi:hypothetical protein
MIREALIKDQVMSVYKIKWNLYLLLVVITQHLDYRNKFNWIIIEEKWVKIRIINHKIIYNKYKMIITSSRIQHHYYKMIWSIMIKKRIEWLIR